MKYLLFILAFGLCRVGDAQNSDHDHSSHDHSHHHHHLNEFAVANSPVYFIKEKEFSYGLHLHFIRTIRESHFGIGLGYERIFDEHKHNSVGVIGSYRPIDPLSFNLSPGIAFEGGSSEVHFSLHLESAYEFAVGDFHIGPVFEVAYDTEDVHLSLGLHIGYGF